ncbi:probable maltase-glucoamylase 2 isoform X2 [Neoarius graeffei]|uniref:probable maltase-glucoamylase 2 isoform X2 n=1 Tax=Neoarius graeffei TaxID=443677 RepID=UPI00298D17ED|nr:probable maltase-glucoamylase 2 isoform X2 [Neoarius graeffei]
MTVNALLHPLVKYPIFLLHMLHFATGLRTLYLCYLRIQVINNTMDWRLIPAILCLIATNASAQATTPRPTTNSSTNTPPVVAAAFNLAFSINETFVQALANTSSPEFAEKAKSICKQLEPIYKQKFQNFIRMVIHSFRNGSILANSTLEFSANGSIPNNTIVQGTLVNATTTNSSLNILANSVNVTEVPATNASAQTTTPSPTTNSSTNTPPVVAAAFNLAFSINETFAPALANTSSPEFAEKAKSIRKQLEPIYKQKFQNFIRMVIHSFRNGSILANSTLEFSANGSIPNNTIVQSTLVNATTTNSSLNILANSVNVTEVPATNASAQTTTPSPTINSSTNTPSVVAAAFNLVFSISETFVPALANTSSPEFAEKAKSIRKQLEPIYKQKFQNFIRMVIHSFRNGSILANSTLEFSANGSIPNNTIVQGTLVNATTTNSSLNILANSVNVTEVPVTTNPTSTPQIVTAIFNLIFSINETFDAALANTSSPQFSTKSKQIRNGLEPIYKQKFQNFIRMVIHSFRNGSILVNSTLEFSANGSIPNNTIVQGTLVNATTTISSLNILPNSVNVTKVPVTNSSTTNPTSTPQIVTAIFNLIFSINETFNAALANTSSPQFSTKSKQIRNGVEPLYKKAFQNFLLMQILNFKNGSILTNSTLSFGPGGSVTEAQVKDTLRKGLANLNFSVDPNSISATQILGNSMPPVIASSLSMIWLSLLSLLLSVALHY